MTRAEAEKADRYNTVKRQATQIVKQVTEHMLVKLLVKQDAVLTDLSRGWRRLRELGCPTMNIEALIDRRMQELFETIEDVIAEADGEVLVCVVPHTAAMIPLPQLKHRRSAR